MVREANSGAGLGDAVLPSSAYSSREFLGLEQRSLFARRWLCVGLIDDVAEPGDVIPLSVAGRALLVSRDWDGEIHVFHNFCRHRGMSLVERPCSALKTLVCPYHSWVYGLDGRLLRTPHIGGFGQHDRDSAIPGLQRVRSAVWHRLLFINLSDDAPAFAEYIEPLAERWAAYDLSLLRRGESARYQIQSNWKLPIENFIDYYHLPSVHPGLNSYSAMEDHYQVENDTYFGQGNQNNRPTDDSAGILPEFPGLNPRQSTVTEAFCLFPNLLITIFNDSLRIILVEPAGPEVLHRAGRGVLCRRRGHGAQVCRCPPGNHGAFH